VYHTYVEKQMTPTVYKDLAVVIPEVTHRLSKVLAILNHKVDSHYPNMMPLVAPKHKLNYHRSLAQTKAECADIAKLSASKSSKQLVQQASLACIASAAETAKLNGEEFLGVGKFTLPKFLESSMPAAAVVLAVARDFLN